MFRVTVRISQTWVDLAHVDFPLNLYPRVRKRAFRYKREVIWEGNAALVDLVKLWLSRHCIDPDHFMIEKI